MTSKGLILLAVVTLLAVIAAVLVQRSVDEPAATGGRYFNNLLSNVNRVEKILVSSKDYEVTLVRSNDGWVVAERNNYPAAVDKVRGMVLGLARLKKIEGKTRNPELYNELGVQAVEDLGAESFFVKLLDRENKALATAIIGKRKGGNSRTASSQFYLREPAEPQAWLVEGKLPRVDSLGNWLQTEIISVAAQRVRQISVQHGDGEIVTVSKASPRDKNYQLEGLEKDEQVKSAYSIDKIIGDFVALRAVDVSPVSEYADRAESPNATTIEMTTFDGLRISLIAHRSDDTIYARLTAAFDEALVWAGSENAGAKDDMAQDGTKQQSIGEEADSAGISENEKGPGLKTAEETRREAAGLNKQWKPWIYQIPAYSFDNLTVRKSDLLKKAAPAADTTTSKKSSAGK